MTDLGLLQSYGFHQGTEKEISKKTAQTPEIG